MRPMRIGPLRIWREAPGIVSRGMAWVAMDDAGYLYIAPTLLGLAFEVLTGWRADRHLVG